MAQTEKLNAALSVEELKEKYGKIYELEIPLEDDNDNVENEYLYLRKLDRKTYSAVSKIMEKDELQAVELALRSLTVKGDAEKIIKDFDGLRIASALIVEIIGVRSGNIRTV